MRFTSIVFHSMSCDLFMLNNLIGNTSHMTENSLFSRNIIRLRTFNCLILFSFVYSCYLHSLAKTLNLRIHASLPFLLSSRTDRWSDPDRKDLPPHVQTVQVLHACVTCLYQRTPCPAQTWKESTTGLCQPPRLHRFTVLKCKIFAQSLAPLLWKSSISPIPI